MLIVYKFQITKSLKAIESKHERPITLEQALFYNLVYSQSFLTACIMENLIYDVTSSMHSSHVTFHSRSAYTLFCALNFNFII